jgi:hypothetical protein
MTQQTINIGTNPNDGTGDTLRTAMIKINQNFSDFYGNFSINVSSGTLTTNNMTVIGLSANSINASANIVSSSNVYAKNIIASNSAYIINNIYTTTIVASNNIVANNIYANGLIAISGNTTASPTVELTSNGQVFLLTQASNGAIFYTNYTANQSLYFSTEGSDSRIYFNVNNNIALSMNSSTVYFYNQVNIPTANISSAINISNNTGLILGTSSKTTNGYTYLPNGLLLQWGSSNASVNSTTSSTVNFSTPYTNVASITLTPIANTLVHYISSSNNSSFVWNNSSNTTAANTNTKIFWQAIGY